MTIFERVLGGNLFFDFWKQLQQYIFSEGRLIQLITLQPIEIYKTDTELEIDTAKVKLSIKSNVENLVQRRIDRALNLLTLNRAENDAKSFAYDFDVIIKAQMAYEEVSRFFNFHFAKQPRIELSLLRDPQKIGHADEFHAGLEAREVGEFLEGVDLKFIRRPQHDHVQEYVCGANVHGTHFTGREQILKRIDRAFQKVSVVDHAANAIDEIACIGKKIQILQHAWQR